MDLQNVAALVRVRIDHETLQRLYDLGIVRPDREPEDLATALPRLAQLVTDHVPVA